ncbi:MAG TPA: hypothetical protein VI542_07370 [Candidatus Tectomicrobia bacterium]
MEWAHQCSYYCQPDAGLHVTKYLQPTEGTLAHAQAFLQAVYGEGFVQVRAAPEADVAAWSAQKDWIGDPLAIQGLAAFLVWVKRDALRVRDEELRRRAVAYELRFPFPTLPTHEQIAAFRQGCGR